MLFFLYLNILLLPHIDVIKIVFVRSVLPYMYMFLTGVLIQRYLTRLQPYLENKGLYWLMFYIASSSILNSVFNMKTTSNHLNHISFFILALTTVSCSFTARGLSKKLLKGNDISYGIEEEIDVARSRHIICLELSRAKAQVASIWRLRQQNRGIDCGLGRRIKPSKSKRTQAPVSIQRQ